MTHAEITEADVEKLVKGYFYKFLVSMMLTILVSFGGAVLSAQRSYAILETHQDELRRDVDHNTVKSDTQTQALNRLSVTISRLETEVSGLRRDLDRRTNEVR